MLLSMTGFGEARTQTDSLSIAVEVRTVNNRYFKLMVKSPDAFSSLEANMEKLVRKQISRGTVSVTMRIDRAGSDRSAQIQPDMLRNYWKQLTQVAENLEVNATPKLESLLPLPGVIADDSDRSIDPQEHWPGIREALTSALDKLTTFRTTEGESMRVELANLADSLAKDLNTIRELAPEVVAGFRDRVLDRVKELLENTDAQVESSDLIREVSIFSERCDITEELTRLQSHLDQFHAFLNGETSQGRKLEFLSQEMFREINTIGAKANNVSIAHAVVDMKAAVEKLREILQNVE